MRNFVRQSKYDPLVQEVTLVEANPDYALVRLPDGRETTVNLRNLAPAGESSMQSPLGEEQEEENQADSPQAQNETNLDSPESISTPRESVSTPRGSISTPREPVSTPEEEGAENQHQVDFLSQPIDPPQYQPTKTFRRSSRPTRRPDYLKDYVSK